MRLIEEYWDGSGLVLYGKRLEQGGFRWPNGLGRRSTRFWLDHRADV
ncbi:MAG: IS66 family insertion sequence element accessory protein TnpB [Hyphomonadaceae bacterium]